MATDTMTSPLSIASQIIPKADQAVINGAPHSEEPVDEGDDRSSSLSELGERAGHDEPDHDLGEVSEANDTEAETERLEDSPQKIRKHQNVILTPANDFYEDRRSPLTSNDWPAIPREHGQYKLAEPT